MILIAHKAHADYPLVIAANRDEFFARPTEAARFWADRPSILAGRDLEAGGTWMGVTRQGRFAALTNYRAPAHFQPGRPSRGRLVTDFLAGTMAPPAYLATSTDYGRQCNGYNLLLGDSDELYWASNVSGESHALAAGIHGVSNHLLDTPWPKLGAGKSALAQALEALPDTRRLFALLADDTVHQDADLPATGVSLEWERLLSAAFIKSTDYGTRSSTVALFGADGRVSFEEQTWLAGAKPGQRRRFAWQREAEWQC